MTTKHYLGDSVYVEIERGMLKLTTNNGVNTIYLEAEVFAELEQYVDNVRHAASSPEPSESGNQ